MSIPIRFLAPLLPLLMTACATLAVRATEHHLGRGPLEREAVRFQDGSQTLTVEREGFRGGELRSDARFGPGVFTARLRCAVPRGALCAFFLYQTGVGDAADELDVEIVGGTRRILFTAWIGGRETHHVERRLPFDPAEGVHAYRIERREGRVRFLVDGVELAVFEGRLPEADMPLFVNAWWPVWLEPRGRESGVLEVEEITWEP